jgi:hypothetical protein
MNVWKVEVDLKYISTASDIERFCTMMDPTDNLADYFNQTDKKPKKNHLHIAIQPLPPITGKCLPMFYLSTKEIEYIVYISFLVMIFFKESRLVGLELLKTCKCTHNCYCPAFLKLYT